MKAEPKRIFLDEVDTIVDAILADPARAGELKHRLRMVVANPKPVTGKRSRNVPKQDPLDELWNNVPL
ncbi:hypothetical protein [Roseitranquillus sediminis]|uniref:hypothetical protein n=1 Tax=Roseitranquillus sediminis TaxID=2809051 RepID=UPI001D0C78AD|nr:hypothetical protein [Roseitranquillus sediminis]MBM9595681.1 hypothetical protein [Roseitranquillus sediminis]